MEIVKLQSAVNSLLECGFCLGVYQDPRILPCGHTFCLQCLQKQYENRPKIDRNETTCGLCRVSWAAPEQGVGSLPRNFIAQNFFLLFPLLHDCGMANDGMEHGKVEYFCTDCWNPLCASCKKAHSSATLTTGHKVKSATEINKEDVVQYKKHMAFFCPYHKKQEMTLYCTDCKEIGCPTCIVKLHPKHDWMDLIDADKNFIELIKSRLESLHKEENTVKNDLSNITNLLKTLDDDLQYSLKLVHAFI